ncbi:Transcription regulator LuxR, C-terminal [Candidatus Nanopelagicaceae bacterium]
MANEGLGVAGVIPGVNLARTLPPVLPPNFISRKSILADIASDRGGLTIVAAPAGYGKTSLVAEFVSVLDVPVVWVTFDDDDDEDSFTSHLMQGLRNVFPNFGKWYSVDKPIGVAKFLTEALTEIGNLKSHLVLVLDNNRNTNSEATPFAKDFLKHLPANVHAIAIRRNVPREVITQLKSMPNFRLIEKSDLQFTEDEIAVAATLKGIDIRDSQIASALGQAYGWPAAVQLIFNNLSRGLKTNISEFANVGGSDQIRILVEDLLSTLAQPERQILEALAVLNEFSIEEARVILQEKFSLKVLNQFANDSLFLNFAADPIRIYVFNSVVRAGLNLSPTIAEDELQQIHRRLTVHFNERGEHLKALEHAKLCGDQANYRNTFRQSMRNLVATGRGKKLLNMAELVGDSTPVGKLKRQTVELMGYTADFQYLNAQSLISEMQFAARGTEMEKFISKFTSAVSVFINFAAGLTETLEDDISAALESSSPALDLGEIDKISLLKVQAAKEIIYDNSYKLEEIQNRAIELSGSSSDSMVLYCLNTIDACLLLSKGEFKDAFIAANNVIAQAERESYAGVFGPLDAMYVKARCFLEFSQIEESQIIFEQIRNLAATWHQHIWVYVAESFIARDLALAGNTSSALEIVRTERGRALALTFKNGLETYCDLTELFIKFTMNDWARVGVLLERLPNFLLVEHIRAIYEVTIGKQPSVYNVAKLPANSAREQIYRNLALADENIDRQKDAIEHIKNALEIGSRVGAKETFLRQEESILNLIIRIAGDQPTLYLEDLSARIPERLKSRSENLIGLTSALTKRELEILRHLETGKPISSIALTLHISQNTMKTHLKNVYRKIGAAGRDEAVLKAKNLYIL